MLAKRATRSVRAIAMERVNMTRFQRGHLMLRNPSMANWPAYVPVIVELSPDARMPTAQM